MKPKSAAWRGWIAVILFVVLGSAAGVPAIAQDTILSETALTELYAERAKQKYPNLTFTQVEPLTIQTEIDTQVVTIGLGNLFAEYKRTPADLEELVAQHLKGVA